MKPICQLINLCKRAQKAISSHLAARSEKRLKISVETDLQLREFDGEIYIAYNDVPIVKSKLLTKDVVTALSASRETLTMYRQRYRNGKC